MYHVIVFDATGLRVGLMCSWLQDRRMKHGSTSRVRVMALVVL